MTAEEYIQTAMGRMNLAGVDIPTIEAQARLAFREARQEFARRVFRSTRSAFLLRTLTTPPLSGGVTNFASFYSLPEPLLNTWDSSINFAYPPFLSVRAGNRLLRFFPALRDCPVTYPSYAVEMNNIYAKAPVWMSPLSGSLTIVAHCVPDVSNLPEQFQEEFIEALIFVITKAWREAVARQGVSNVET